MTKGEAPTMAEQGQAPAAAAEGNAAAEAAATEQAARAAQESGTAERMTAAELAAMAAAVAEASEASAEEAPVQLASAAEAQAEAAAKAKAELDEEKDEDEEGEEAPVDLAMEPGADVMEAIAAADGARAAPGAEGEGEAMALAGAGGVGVWLPLVAIAGAAAVVALTDDDDLPDDDGEPGPGPDPDPENQAPEFTSEDNAVVDATGEVTSETVIYTAEATDADGDDITFSLAEGGDAALFTIDEATGEVRFLEDPDFAGVTGYSFTVVATDSEGNETSQEVIIALDTEGNDAPQFASDEAEANVDEEITTDLVVFTANAVDADGDEITYSLTGEHADLFEIDPATGEVTFVEVPGEDAPTSYNFTVVASDGETETSQNVTLTVGPEVPEEPETVDEALANLAAAEGALDAAREDASDEELETAVTNAEGAVDTARTAIADAAIADPEVDSADYEAAATALSDAQTAQAGALAAQEAEVDTFNTANDADITVAEDGTVEGLIVLNAETGALELAEGVDDASNPGVTDLLTDVQARVAADEALDTAEQNEATEFEALETALDDAALSDALDTAEADLTTAEADLAAREGLIADVEAAEQALAEVEGAVSLGADPVTATAETDLYLLADDTGDITITDFGTDGEDALFADGYTEGDAGDDAVLEVFIEQDGENTVLYFEDAVDTGAPVDGETYAGTAITLEGIDAASVSVSGAGLITIEDTAPAGA